jgi:hypothetical protein
VRCFILGQSAVSDDAASNAGLSGRGSAAGRLLVLWVCIPPGTWMYVSCELSGKEISVSS